MLIIIELGGAGVFICTGKKCYDARSDSWVKGAIKVHFGTHAFCLWSSK
jgi:hypothetical protein